MPEIKKNKREYSKSTNQGKTPSRLLQQNLVFLPADFYPQQDPWDHPKTNSRPYKYKRRPSPCSSILPELIHVHGLFQFSLKSKCLKTRNPNLSFG